MLIIWKSFVLLALAAFLVLSFTKINRAIVTLATATFDHIGYR